MSIARLSLLAFGVTLIAATSAFAAERTFEKSFPSSAGGSFAIQTDLGDVDIVGTERQSVVIRTTLQGSPNRVEGFKVDAQDVGGRISVRGQRPDRGWSFSWLFDNSLRVHYAIELPRNYAVTLKTSGGDIVLRALDGRVEAQTSGGDVQVESLGGDVIVQTSGGDIEGRHLRGRTTVQTSGGDIAIDGAPGSIEARTSGGDVRLKAVGGRIIARTSGGDIQLVRAQSQSDTIELHTSGGDIDIALPAHYAAQLDASTSGGDVDCSLPLQSDDRASGKNKRTLRGTLNGGGPLLQARTHGGDIIVRSW